MKKHHLLTLLFSCLCLLAWADRVDQRVAQENGTVLLPDATGLYVIEDIQEDVVVTITGIVKESPSAIEGPGYTMTSVWTGQGQIHIQLGKDVTVTVSDYSGRIVKTFKEKVGDYHISIQKGSYIVSVDGLTYKVVVSASTFCHNHRFEDEAVKIYEPCFSISTKEVLPLSSCCAVLRSMPASTY